MSCSRDKGQLYWKDSGTVSQAEQVNDQVLYTLPYCQQDQGNLHHLSLPRELAAAKLGCRYQPV